MNANVFRLVLACVPLLSFGLSAQTLPPLPAPQECAPKFSDKAWCASRADLRGFLEMDFPEYPGGPKARYRAEAFSEVSVLWASTTQALLLANALPPTKATPTVLSSLILLRQSGGAWSIGHSMTFLASGKYSSAKAEPAEEGAAAVVTLTLTQGGRGNAYSQSETFRIDDQKIQRVPLPAP